VVEGLPANQRAFQATITEDLLEELPLRDGRLRLPMRPWQVATIVVPARA